MKVQKHFSFVLLCAALFVLPQCGGDSKEAKKDSVSTAHSGNTAAVKHATSNDKSEVLLTVGDAKDVKITADNFNEYLEEFLEAQPQYRQFIEFMPDAEENIFQGMVNEVLLDEWIKKEGIDKKAGYQKDLEKIMKYGRRSLAVKYFQDEHPVTVTAMEVKKYYDENKDKMPELMAQKGGVKAEAVLFTSQESAQAFLDKVKANVANFAKDAKAANHEVKDFGVVGDQSFEVQAPIRTKLIAIKTFPSVELIKVDDKTFAVVKAVSKVATQYVPFDQIKEGIENYLKQQKAGELLQKEIEKLKGAYKTTVNKDFFDRKKKAKEESAQKAQAAAQAKSAPAKPAAPAGKTDLKPGSNVKGA